MENIIIEMLQITRKTKLKRRFVTYAPVKSISNQMMMA